MALNSSGQISMNDIRIELGIPTQSPFSLDTAENGSYVLLNQCSPSKPSSTNPASISEWYSYCHTCSCGTFDCDDSQNNGSGGMGFYNYTINLGSSVGTVRLSYYAYSVPDKFVVNYNGTDVIDTGFRGDSGYNSQLNALGYPNVSGSGNGYFDFVKSTASPTTASVQVIAPLDGTAWDFTLGCPYYSYSLSYSATSCGEACSSGVVTTYYSTCSGLTQFCVLRTGPSNDNFNSSAASVGYYSDGTTCYYVGSGGLAGQITSVSACPTPTPTPSPTATLTATPTPAPTSTPTPTPTQMEISIDISVPSSMIDDNNPYIFAAETSGQVYTVDTDVYVNIDWIGDLGGTAYSSVVIYTGTACNKDINVTFVPNIPSVLEYYSSLNVTIVPSSYGTQNYNQGTIYLKGELDAYPC